MILDLSNSLIDYFSKQENIQLINDLKESGLNFEFEEKQKDSLEKVKRWNLKKKMSSISKNTTFVLLGYKKKKSRKKWGRNYIRK